MKNFKFALTTAALISSIMFGAVTAFAADGALDYKVFEKKMDEIMETIDENYMGEYRADGLEDAVLKELVSGMGDGFMYIPASEAELFFGNNSGSFVGIGVSLEEIDGAIKLYEIFPGSPAEEAGLLPDDQIVEVDGVSVSGKDTGEISAMVTGEEGTEVTVTYYRPSEGTENEVSIIRRPVTEQTVYYREIAEDIWYIVISRFMDTTPEQFDEAYDDAVSNGMKGLVIDLRFEVGGQIDAVLDVADMLVPEGVIAYAEDKNGEREYHYSDKRQIIVPLTIIMNEDSSVATEIFAGACRDHEIAVIVGTASSGVGSSQGIFEMPDGSVLVMTALEYYTPNGLRIRDAGIEPDYEVELSEELTQRLYEQELEFDEDLQLQKAVELIEQELSKQALFS